MNIVCVTPIYRYKGWTFEFHPVVGPWPLTGEMKHRQKAGAVFWAVFDDFASLQKNEQEQYRLSGGCYRY